MKKLMKAIAFATVMCMLLSTAAFAATTADNGVDNAAIAESKTVTVNVTGAGANAQVALLLVEGEVTDATGILPGNIEHIDQQEADASGNVTFGPITTKNEADEVSVFVGYEGAAAQYVGTVALEEQGETVVLIEHNVTKIVSNTREELGEENVNAEVLIGAGAAATFTIPAEYEAEKMIWSLTVDGGAKKFSEPVEFSSVLSGDVKLAVAFMNGSTADSSIETYTISAVDAIFRLKKVADSTYVDAFTDATDAGRMTQE